MLDCKLPRLPSKIEKTPNQLTRIKVHPFGKGDPCCSIQQKILPFHCQIARQIASFLHYRDSELTHSHQGSTFQERVPLCFIQQEEVRFSCWIANQLGFLPRMERLQMNSLASRFNLPKRVPLCFNQQKKLTLHYQIAN